MQDIDVYIDLQETVLEYKHGNNMLAEDIINRFSDFLWRYVNLVCHGKFQIEDAPLRRFVSLFTPSIKGLDISKTSGQYYFKKSIKDKLIETSVRITQLFDQYTETEIRNEIICILLNMAKKYSDYNRPSFHTYVERCFHFEAFRGLEKLIKDPISRQEYYEYKDHVICSNSLVDFSESIQNMDKSLSIKLNDNSDLSDTSTVFEDETLNENWINGITCSEELQILTSFERKILVEHIINNKTDSEISEEFGLCRATINRRRLSAIKKIKAQYSIT